MRLVMQAVPLLISVLIGFSSYTAYGAEAISCGMNIPEFTLNAPDSEKARQYLGLKNVKSFCISEVPAKLVLLELYSLYCTACQRQAPIANKLYKFIQQDPDLSQDIRMIGIGAGNNQREVVAYKTRFRVPFPLFPDSHFQIHKKFGEPRTPFTVLVTNSGKVLMTHSGIVKDLDKFLSEIRKVHKQQ